MGGCAFGPCDNSVAMGGAGCYLCDVVSKLPQPPTALELQQRVRAATDAATRRGTRRVTFRLDNQSEQKGI